MNTLLFKSLVLAQQAGEAVAQATPDAANGGAAAGRPAQGSPFGSLWIFIPIFGLMYFLMIRPQQKKQKEIQKFRNSLTVGQDVVTIGGLHGTIKSIANNTIVLKVATGVDLTFEKSAIVPVGTPAGQQA